MDYDLLDLGIQYRFKAGIRGRVDFNLHAGAFLNNRSMYFIDFRHFMGNRTPIITSNQASSYRLLDYYQYSTQDKNLNVITHYHFRKLLVTHIPKVRLMGIQEKMFASYLRKPTSRNYTALSYSIDGILRAFRVEGTVSLANGRYGMGIRLGLASNIGVNLRE